MTKMIESVKLLESYKEYLREYSISIDRMPEIYEKFKLRVADLMKVRNVH